MSRPIIEARSLAKVYRLGELGAASLREEATALWHRLSGKAPTGATREFWALRDVSFDVQPGEVVGIIGRNGAGKSTLLKILSRITEPTRGRAVLRGRVASLLEVGTGFHPDLSGRDNIFLNGAILGMTHAEVLRKFDEIVAFAEVDQFIDTPVKRYSSGMYVRLAFAVAAHLEPEILIVDEVLAVGDAQFQKKCLGKMESVARGHGRTVLFVSHNMVAVQSLCNRAVLLENGNVVAEGSPAAAISHYMRGQHDSATTEWPEQESAPGNDLVRIKRVSVLPELGAGDRLITMKSSVQIITEFWSERADRTMHLTYHLLNDQGIVVLTSGSPAGKHTLGLHRLTCHLPGGLLNSGGYTLKLLVVENENVVTYAHDNIASFTVVDQSHRENAWMGREPGVVQPLLRWDEKPFETGAR